MADELDRALGVLGLTTDDVDSGVVDALRDAAQRQPAHTLDDAVTARLDGATTGSTSTDDDTVRADVAGHLRGGTAADQTPASDGGPA